MSEEKKLPTRILVVGSGGPVGLAMEVAKRIAEKNYDVQIVTPRDAKLMGMKPNDEKHNSINDAILPSYRGRTKS